MANPEIEQEEEWAKARWENGGYAFCLMGKRDKEELAEFF